MTSYQNDTSVDIDENHSEVETDKNHTYVEISTFLLENSPYPFCNNQWEKFVGELQFDKISAIAANGKSWKKNIHGTLEQVMAHRYGLISKDTEHDNLERSED